MEVLEALLSFTFSFFPFFFKDVNSFITETISNLKEFEQIFSVDEYKIKVSSSTLSVYFFFIEKNIEIFPGPGSAHHPSGQRLIHHHSEQQVDRRGGFIKYDNEYFTTLFLFAKPFVVPLQYNPANPFYVDEEVTVFDYNYYHEKKMEDPVEDSKAEFPF